MADAMTQPFNRLSVTQLGTPVVCCWSLAAVARRGILMIVMLPPFPQAWS